MFEEFFVSGAIFKQSLFKVHALLIEKDGVSRIIWKKWERDIGRERKEKEWLDPILDISANIAIRESLFKLVVFCSN